MLPLSVRSRSRGGCFTHEDHIPMNMKRVELRDGGMFSNVNEVVQRLHLAGQGGFGFAIRWPRSVYRDEDRTDDPWSYFFEPCFPEQDVDVSALEHWDDYGLIIRGADNTITPRAGWRDGGMLIFPKNRQIAAQHINARITLKPNIQAIIDKFVETHFDGPVIGLHIRGEGRDHGGAAELRAQLPCENGVPYRQYFHLVQQELQAMPDAKILICSDSRKVIDRVSREFGDKVIWYDSSRSDFGEMHERHKSPDNEHFSGYKLGEDILVEAYLLACTDVFIHGNSNVANFVICKNPDLKIRYAYEGVRPFTLPGALWKLAGDTANRVRRKLGLID